MTSKIPMTNSSGTTSDGGYCKMGDGTLIQWGEQTTSGLLTTYVNLSQAFKDTSFTVMVTPIANSNSAGNITYTSNNTTTNFSVGVNNASVVASFHWIAIGRWK